MAFIALVIIISKIYRLMMSIITLAASSEKHNVTV